MNDLKRIFFGYPSQPSVRESIHPGEPSRPKALSYILPIGPRSTFSIEGVTSHRPRIGSGHHGRHRPEGTPAALAESIAEWWEEATLLRTVIRHAIQKFLNSPDDQALFPLRLPKTRRGHCQVNWNSLFFDAKSTLVSTNNQQLSRHVNQWNLQEISKLDSTLPRAVGPEGSGGPEKHPPGVAPGRRSPMGRFRGC